MIMKNFDEMTEEILKNEDMETCIETIKEIKEEDLDAVAKFEQEHQNREEILKHIEQRDIKTELRALGYLE